MSVLRVERNGRQLRSLRRGSRDRRRRDVAGVGEGLAGQGIAKPGTPLPEFVEATYATFFGEMVRGGADERELAAWIQPRLEVMRHSLLQHMMNSQLQVHLAALGTSHALRYNSPHSGRACHI